MASRGNPRRLSMADVERLGPAARAQIRAQLGGMGPVTRRSRQPQTQSVVRPPTIRNPWPVSYVLISVTVLLVSWLAVAHTI